MSFLKNNLFDTICLKIIEPGNNICTRSWTVTNVLIPFLKKYGNLGDGDQKISTSFLLQSIPKINLTHNAPNKGIRFTWSSHLLFSQGKSICFWQNTIKVASGNRLFNSKQAHKRIRYFTWFRNYTWNLVRHWWVEN